MCDASVQATESWLALAIPTANTILESEFDEAVNMPMTSNHVQQRVEAMCQQGCDAVRSYIRAMEEKLPLSQLDGLDGNEKDRILTELKAIMAVYDRPRDN